MKRQNRKQDGRHVIASSPCLSRRRGCLDGLRRRRPRPDVRPLVPVKQASKQHGRTDGRPAAAATAAEHTAAGGSHRTRTARCTASQREPCRTRGPCPRPKRPACARPSRGGECIFGRDVPRVVCVMCPSRRLPLHLRARAWSAVRSVPRRRGECRRCYGVPTAQAEENGTCNPTKSIFNPWLISKAHFDAWQVVRSLVSYCYSSKSETPL